MEKRRYFYRVVFILIYLLLIFIVSHVDAKIPDVVAKQKKAVVTVYVNDKDGKKVVSGSGFIVDRNGIIATNCHVIVKWLEEVGHALVVKLEDGAYVPMEDVFHCSFRDNFALLKIKAKDLPTVKLAPHYRPKKGEHIAVIGSPSGVGITISDSIIKSVGDKDGFMQVSLPITQGSNGSPVFNFKGEVIGVATSPLKKKQKYHVVVSVRHVENQLDKYRKKLMQKLVSIDERIDRPEKPDAINRITREIEKTPDNAELYFLLGAEYDARSRYEEAIKAYRQAVRIKPDFGEAYVNLGLDYYKLGNYKDAIEAYKQAIKIKPDSQPIYNKLSTIYIILGEYSLALNTLKQAIPINPRNSVVHFNLGIAYFLNGDRKAAFEEYVILKDLDKERAENLLDLMY